MPFDIPESWEWVRLEAICTKLVDGDHNPPKGCSYETAYVMVSSTNINDDCIVELEKVRYLEKTFSTRKMKERTLQLEIFSLRLLVLLEEVAFMKAD